MTLQTGMMMTPILSGPVIINCPDGSVIKFEDVIDYAYFNKVVKQSAQKLEELMMERHIEQMMNELKQIENGNTPSL